jgi:hypothetical protein
MVVRRFLEDSPRGRRLCRVLTLRGDLKVVVEAKHARHKIGSNSSESQIRIRVHDTRQGHVAVFYDMWIACHPIGGSFVIPPARRATDGPALGPPRLEV